MSLLTNSPEAPNDLPDEVVLVQSVSKPWLYGLLVDRYQAAFMRKTLGILRNQLDAEEVVLDTFTKIYFNANSFTPQAGAKFSSWAYRILLNTTFTRYQKLVKNGQRFQALDPEFEQLVADNSVEKVMNQDQDAVGRVLARLPGHFSYVLRLHYLERWSHQDIANESGDSVGSVKARIHRAKKAFRAESQNGELHLPE